MIGPLFASIGGATAALIAVALIAFVASLRRPGPPGPLARRLGPFLDLLDARYAPLLFVATPQSFTVYAWLLADGAPAWVAVLGGVGFEFVYVGAIAWAERGAGWPAARVPAITALVFSVAVAVAHYGAESGALAVLHIGFPLVGYAYMRMMHAPTGPRPDELAHERDTLAGQLAHAEQERTVQQHEVARAWATVDELRAEVDHWQGVAAHASQAAARPTLTADHETVQIGGRAYSTRDAAEALGIPKSTLTRKLAQFGPKES
jgi:hypothetical protein